MHIVFSIWARIILRISYVSHRYCSISQRIAAYCKNIVIGGKVGMELGEIGRSSHFGKPRGPSNWSRSRACSFTALHMVCWDGWALSRAMGCTFRRPWRSGDITRSKWYHGSITFEWWTPSRLACVAMSAIPLLSGVVPGISTPSEDDTSRWTTSSL